MITTKAANYLNFDKSRMVNLEYSLKREILRTNRRGAYHCTTIAECNTRKQHGLLVMPVPRLGDTNHVLLSSFDETIIQHGAEFNLGIHKYDGDNYSPMGHKYIREFSCDVIPKIIYRVGGVILSKEKMFSLENNTIFIRYTLLDAHSPTTIRFRPFLAFREVNSLTQENSVANHGYKEVENGISMCMYSGYPELFMQFNKPDVKFHFAPNWYKGIEYPRDMEADLPYKEDLYVPGYFEMPLAKGESVIFAASDTPASTEGLLKLFSNGIVRRTPRSSLINCLKNSAHQFYYRPTSGGSYLLSGYPWGGVTAREQFMALEGLTISADRIDVFKDIMDTAIPAIYDLIDGKPNKSLLKGIDDSDVLLWVIRSLKRFYDKYPQEFKDKYADVVQRIVEFILNDKHPKLRVLENRLLYTDGTHQSVSWMDGTHNGSPVVSRTGCLVEINVFWYNSLMFCKDLAEEYKLKNFISELEDYATRVRVAFCDTFLNSSGYLFDYVDGNYGDWSVRPNMLYAISSFYPILDKRQSKTVLDYITKELLTTKGLRTLSPKSGGYRPRYEGSSEEREYSAYNGVTRPWFIAPYMEAYLKIFQTSGLSFLDRVIAGIEDEMANGCIGSLSEMYDGSMPSEGHGAISYSVSIAGVLRALNFRETFEEEYLKRENALR